ncbi:chromosome segregation protein ScpA [Mycoplasma capricolum subsp. capripneumoniae]|uniref:Segregation and condensation protein A n=1 Tax=Mycoplasma capricolum subsp. capripneumoniae 87001 TaxID=1124992 RepID=A0A9N7B156_MYCCC|nr:segregation/condensation protein A [Mycoplasma capricolum]AJK51625.1 cell division protein ScpA [Mycoplasma capricolum subsp. capripneumoniae 87001]AOQ22272.1 chromosome segregation protein ScpA [Mycoplasma capricolum subsp. capripneumoniae M1601]AQU77613.1 chromosome segregation protein ScpA [Mycoplasma capricolum subsp. capripneumoniae]KEY84637.1 chromosomal segregation and condensation proteinA [Mycoplasma capricolum subsp. capripneumoniae 99108]QDL19733.1 chromosome segregation protein 
MKHWQELTIDQFSGPIELLWLMIKEKKLDIVELSLLEIVDQYLAYIKQNQQLDIEIASEYLIIASQLIELKSRYLLFKDQQDEQVDQIDYDDLVYQISQYNQIKEISDQLFNAQEVYLQTFSKKRSKQAFKKDLIFKNPEPLIDLNDLDLDKLTEIFYNVITNSKSLNYQTDFELETEIYQTLTTPSLSVHEVILDVVNKVTSNKLKEWKLEELLDILEFNLKNFIVIFLAILDLVRYQILEIDTRGKDIYVCLRKEVIENENLITQQLEVIANETTI